jgi:hypothetical protein
MTAWREREAKIVLVAVAVIDQRQRKSSISPTKMTPGHNALGSCRKMSCDNVLGALARKALPKNLSHLLPVQGHKDEGSGDLLVRSQVHTNERAGVLAVAAQQ